MDGIFKIGGFMIIWPFSRKKSCPLDAPPVSSETMPLLNWLKELPERDGIVFIML
jgi:hypothetical protein